jgi:hypothetical protein
VSLSKYRFSRDTFAEIFDCEAALSCPCRAETLICTRSLPFEG